jgi:hypothetical protein
MPPIPWSDAEDVRLRKLARSGIGIVEIAAHLGRTKSAIRARVEKLNIAVARQQNPMQLGKLSKGATSKS